MEKPIRLTDYFGANLAHLLAEKIVVVFTDFDESGFVNAVRNQYADKALKQRVELIADCLNDFLPHSYPEALAILNEILGPENEKETGMFTDYYWLMPIGKFVEKYGLEYYDESIAAIGEITKRNTGEYAIRPYIRACPDKTLSQMKQWAHSENFHLRRLASEGLRPRLPWAPRLNLFIENPEPVFEILNLLNADPVRFVRKSVANHLTDYVKENPRAVEPLLDKWSRSNNGHTRWILKQVNKRRKS